MQVIPVGQREGAPESRTGLHGLEQKPKLLPYLATMVANLAGALAVDPGEVSIKGKTNEGVDSMGTGESIAVHAVALVTRIR